jgi:hypothetical protein
MPTATYIALANLTLSGTDATVTFSSIPATYRDLVVVISTRSDTNAAADNMGLYFNSDTGNNYSTLRMLGTGSTTVSGTAPTSARIAQLTVPAANLSTQFGVATVHIMDYSATDKHKTVLVRSNTAGDQVHAAAGRWASTNAITSVSIDLYATSANFVSGSTFALYGIVS